MDCLVSLKVLQCDNHPDGGGKEGRDNNMAIGTDCRRQLHVHRSGVVSRRENRPAGADAGQSYG